MNTTLKFYRAREVCPLPPTKDSMKTAVKFLNQAGERWMEGSHSDRRTQLVYIAEGSNLYKDRDRPVYAALTQREFEHKVIFTYELKMPVI